MKESKLIGVTLGLMGIIIMIISLWYDIRNLRDNYFVFNDIVSFSDGVFFSLSLMVLKITSIIYIINLIRGNKKKKK